jgi:hypothetical protein
MGASIALGFARPMSRLQKKPASAALGRRMRDGRAKPRTLLSAKDPVPERSRGVRQAHPPVPERSRGTGDGYALLHAGVSHAKAYDFNRRNA